MYSTQETRYYVDLCRNENYITGCGELESMPFMIGSILKDDSDRPMYDRRIYSDADEVAAVGVIGLGRRWKMRDGRRVGKPKSMLVRIEFFDVGVTVFEVGNVIKVDVDGRIVKAIYGRGELGGRSIRFEFHPKTEDASGGWHPAFIDVGPVVYDPFTYVRDEESIKFGQETEALSADKFFPHR